MKKMMKLIFGETKDEVILFVAILVTLILVALYIQFDFYLLIIAVIFFFIVRLGLFINNKFYGKKSTMDFDINVNDNEKITKKIEQYNIKLLELEALEKKSNGCFSVMSVSEKANYTFSYILVIIGMGLIIKSVLDHTLDHIFDNLSLAAFGIAIHSIILTQAKERLSKKVIEVKSSLDRLQKKLTEEKIDQIKKIVEETWSKVDKKL